MQKPNKFPAILLALLMVGTVLLVSPASSYPVTAAQQTTAEAEFGPGAPYGSWENKIETHAFYLHDGGNAPAGLEVPDQYLSSALPLSDTPASRELQGTAELTDIISFPLADHALAREEVRLYGFGAAVYAICSADPLLSGTALFAEFHIEDLEDDGTWDRRDHNGGDPGVAPYRSMSLEGGLVPWSPAAAGIVAPADEGLVSSVALTQFSGYTNFQNPLAGNGLYFDETVRVVLELSIDFLSPDCEMYFDAPGAASRLFVQSDSARMSSWIEDSEGVPRSGIPSAQSRGAADRIVTFRHLQSSPWPGAGPTMSTDMECNAEDGCDVSRMDSLQIRRLNDNDVINSDWLLLDSENTIHANDIVDYRRTFQYDAETVDGVYRMEFAKEELPLPGDGWPTPRPWELVEDFNIGLKDLELGLAPFETPTHLINRGETTEFRFRLTNHGSDNDLVVLGVSQPGSGWTAQLDTSLASLAGGADAFVTLTVTTSEATAIGATRSITVTATSQYEEVPTRTFTVDVTTTSTILNDVEIHAQRDTVRMSPGTTESVGLTVINRGHAADNFVIAPNLPSDAANWGLAVSPLAVQLPAGGMSEVLVTLTAPGEVPEGFTFELDVDARRVGDASVVDDAIVTIELFVREGLQIDVLGPTTKGMREIADTFCRDSNLGFVSCETPEEAEDTDPLFGGDSVSDSDYDTSVIHRLRLTNSGDAPLPLEVDLYWDNGAISGETDSGACDGLTADTLVGQIGLGTADGVPDGWRFRYADDIGTPFPGVGSQPRAHEPHPKSDPLVIPARDTIDIFLEMGYLEGDVCGELANVDGSQEVSSSYSRIAAMTFDFKSTTDTTLRESVTLVNSVQDFGGIVGENIYTGAVRGVGIEPFLDGDTRAPATETEPAVFELLAFNEGNELDDLIIDISDSEEGWDYTIAPVPGRHVPSTIVCDPVEEELLRFRCNGVGIYDEIALRVTATPGPAVKIGDRAAFEVRVTSGDDPSKRDTLDLTARLAGTYAYEVRMDNREIDVTVGDQVSVPFTIENIGTEGDTYSVAIFQADPAYNARIGGPTEVFVPGGHRYTGIVTMDVPSTAPVGQAELLELFIDSPNVPAIKASAFIRPVAASALTVEPVDTSGGVIRDALIPERGVATTVNFRATHATGSLDDVDFSVDSNTLPRGWSASPVTVTETLAGTPQSTATASFQVTAPEDALGSSRVPLRIHAELAGAPTTAHAADLILNVASQFGIGLSVIEGTEQVISAGDDAVYTVVVENLGLASDTVTLSASGAPPGWTSTLDQVTIPLGPLQREEVTLTIRSPTSAAPGTVATTILFASSASDPTASTGVEILTNIGRFELDAAGPIDQIFRAPQEVVTRVFNITNNGTVPDRVTVAAALDTAGLANHVTFSIEPTVVELDPGESADILLEATVGAGMPPGSELIFSVTGSSTLDPASPAAAATAEAAFRVLEYEADDIDGDGTLEYAIDRDRDSGNGFEEFRENLSPSGFNSVALDMTTFLSNAARTAFTAQVADDDGNVTMVLIHEVDGDRDGLRDHFVDHNADGLPDVYWDADDQAFDQLTVQRDIDADGILDYFMSLDDDDDLDAVYNLRSGRFTYLLQLEIDGDGRLDYVVDKNGDGTRNPNEAVLLSNSGNLVSIVKVDMTGNGDLDDVVDANGDGVPDHFVPAGSSDGISIKVKDVTGDGVNDWTYDADGDGREDSYYNPQDGSVGTIDVAENFVELIKEYWYVLILFGLVTVLFVVLVAVTRR